MSCRMKIIVLVVVSITMRTAGKVNAANILCLAPSPAISHYQMLEPLLLTLAGRGHNVTVLSCFPQKEKLANYTDVSLREEFSLYELDFQKWNLWEDMWELFNYGNEHCKKFASSNVVQQFIRADNKFDLIILEAFHSECFLGLVEKFKAPYIVFSAMAIPIWQSDWIYNPTEPAYLPDNICRLSGRMRFQDKLQNIVCHVGFRWLNWWQNSDRSVNVAREHFGVDIDTFADIRRNVSLVLVNSFHGITGIRPNFPSVVEVGGIHLKSPKALPQDLEKFLSESRHGVVVISMGSIVKSKTLNLKTQKHFSSVISKLNERVIWKWEGEFPNKPDNLLTVSWMPQFDILEKPHAAGLLYGCKKSYFIPFCENAKRNFDQFRETLIDIQPEIGHPNVKLFISHGGIHSLYEAIQNGVPIIGIPLFGDQIANLKNLELKGVAVVLDLADLTEKTLSSAIAKVLGNDRKSAQELSRIFRDQPQTPLERAIFWMEHILRHKGAPHFQSEAVRLSWLQYSLIDVLLFCISFFTLLITVFYYSLKILRII